MKRSQTRIGALLPILVLAACSGDEHQATERPVADVEVVVSQPVQASGGHSHVGTLVADQVSHVSTRTAARVERVLVEAGDRVSRGAVMVVLDTTGIEAEIRAAEARVELARKGRDRLIRLAEQGAASTQEADGAIAEFDMANAALDAVRSRRTDGVVRAPFDGHVTRRSVDPGAMALPGVPLVTVQSVSATTVRVHLPSDAWPFAEAGTEVEVSEPSTGWASSATIARRTPLIGEASRRFEVELTLPAGPAGPVPGTHVDVVLLGSDAPSLWIPSDAVVRRGQLTGVWLEDDGLVRLRWISVGATVDDRTEVLAGLDTDASVVRDPVESLRDGDRIAGSTVSAWSLEAGEGGT